MEEIPPRQRRSMKMTDYEKVYDFQSLYNAYQLAARGKHGRPDVIQFEMDEPPGEPLAASRRTGKRDIPARAVQPLYDP